MSEKQTGLANLSPEELLALARDKGAESRSRLSKVISDLFSGGAEVLSDRERMLMFSILHSVFKDIEFSVRKNIAENLSGAIDIPSDFLSALANDDIEVAYPILTRCDVIKDTELIEVVRHRTLEHQMAVAARKGVSPEVSDALVDTGRKDVIKTLLENQDAMISQKTMAYLVEESRRVDDFQEPILSRDELPADLAKRMFLWVSAALRKHIVETYKLDEATIDDLLEKAANQNDLPNGNKAAELADSIGDADAITSDMLISALDSGQVRLFVSLLARKSRMREQLITRMLFESGGEGLAITCKALAMSQKDFLTVFAYSRRADPKGMQNFVREKRQAQDFFAKLTDDAAMSVLRNWQRDKDYLAAIRQLDISKL